jgi:hypothetical protein
MGRIRISFNGSFGTRTEDFVAVDHGHVEAVASAIEFLAEVGLARASSLDHTLHDQGHAPKKGWHRPAEPGTGRRKRP